MNIKLASNRFIRSSFELKGAFYQHLISRMGDFHSLGTMLVQQAQKAQAFRQIDVLENVSMVLSYLPLREYELIGQYYLGWCAYRKGGEAKDILEKVIEGSSAYRAMALIDMASIEADHGDFGSVIKLYSQALKYSSTLHTIVQAARSAAAVKGLEGYHKSALKDLERIKPLVRYAQPIAHYQYLNSLAVELGEVGRLEEAQNISKIVLASPYIKAYPEWRETEQDLALRGYKSRSSVRVKHIPRNLFYLPERSTVVDRPKPGFVAPVVDYVEWKKKMVKEPNGNGEELPEDMTVQQMAMKIIELITKNKDNEDKLRDLLEQALKIYSKK
jgi:tetratricopeptide (TPR) repeat protein